MVVSISSFCVFMFFYFDISPRRRRRRLPLLLLFRFIFFLFWHCVSTRFDSLRKRLPQPLEAHRWFSCLWPEDLAVVWRGGRVGVCVNVYARTQCLALALAQWLYDRSGHANNLLIYL